MRRKKLRLRGVKRRREQAQGAADVAATELAQTKEELERTQGVDVGVMMRCDLWCLTVDVIRDLNAMRKEDEFLRTCDQ